MEKFSHDLTNHLLEVAANLNVNIDRHQEAMNLLLDHVLNDRPAVIFFLDRSARPVVWMLKAFCDELKKQNLLQTDFSLPQIRFMTTDRAPHKQPTAEAIKKAQIGYRFIPPGNILVVDEISGGKGFYDRKRVVDLAGEILEEIFPKNKIILHVYLDLSIKGGNTPLWFRGDETLKNVLYGIQDASSDSVISKAGTREENKLRKNNAGLIRTYREIFARFGAKIARRHAIKGRL